jgi:gas vesicle protein/transcriptional regulator with XRE-family HTH domain
MAMHTWPQLIERVFALFPESSDVELAERFGVTRQTIATWKRSITDGSASKRAPDWSSIEAVAKGLLNAVESAQITPKTVEEMALIGWAHQVTEKKALFSISNTYLLSSFFNLADKKETSWRDSLFGGGAGAGLGASAFLLGSTVGPIGVAIGAAIGAAAGYYLSKETTKQNAKLKNDLESYIQGIGDQYKDLLLQLATQLCETEKQFEILQKNWAFSLEKLLKENKNASARLPAELKDNIYQNIEMLPSPLRIFDIEGLVIQELVKELKNPDSRK